MTHRNYGLQSREWTREQGERIAVAMRCTSTTILGQRTVSAGARVIAWCFVVGLCLGAVLWAAGAFR